MRQVVVAIVIGWLFCVGNVGARTVAVAVGIDNYSTGWPQLPSCVNDANGFLTHLRDFDGALWPECYITTDGEAKKGFIRVNIQTFASELQPGDVFVYFHSSHGGSSGGLSTYVCCNDDVYRDSELAADLALFNPGVTVIVIVDACNSGGLFKSTDSSALSVEGAVDTTWDFGRRVSEHLAVARRATGAVIKAGASIAFITACDYDHICYAGTPYSLFTRYLLEAFTQGDGDGSGSLSFYELYAYAGPKAKAAAVAYGDLTNQDAQSFNDPVLQSTAVVGQLPAAVAGDGGGGCTVARTADMTWAMLLPWLLVAMIATCRRFGTRPVRGACGAV